MISTDTVYTLPELKAELGIERGAIRQMRINGLPIFYVANRGLVRGSDFNEWLTAQSQTPPGPKTGFKQGAASKKTVSTNLSDTTP